MANKVSFKTNFHLAKISWAFYLKQHSSFSFMKVNSSHRQQLDFWLSVYRALSLDASNKTELPWPSPHSHYINECTIWMHWIVNRIQRQIIRQRGMETGYNACSLQIVFLSFSASLLLWGPHLSLLPHTPSASYLPFITWRGSGGGGERKEELRLKVVSGCRSWRGACWWGEAGWWQKGR